MLIKQHLGFQRLKINGTALVSGFQQQLKQLVEVLQIGQQPGLILTGLFFARQPFPDLVVGQTGFGMHDRRVKPMLLDVAEAGDFHFTDHAQTVNLGIQRAQAVRQFFRQHRNHTAREVHRIAAFKAFSIQRRTWLNVVRHIGNGHPQTEAASLGLAIHRIVKVACVFAIDGDEGQFTHVFAVTAQIFFQHGFRQFFRLCLDVIRENMRQTVFAQGNFNFHTGVGVAPQNLRNLAHRRRVLRRLLNQFHHHDLIGTGPHIGMIRNQNVLADFLVFSHDPLVATFTIQAPDQRFIDALQHLDNLAFLAAAPIYAMLTHHDPVTMQDTTHFLFVQKIVARLVFRHKKAESVCMPFNSTNLDLNLLWQAQGTATIQQ